MSSSQKQQELNDLLHKYAFEGKKSKLKSLLKTENLNLDALDCGGHTALYYACINGHKCCVKLLLEHGANPNERSKNGATAVHAACLNGQTKVLDLLIQYGGDLRLHDNENRIPKAWALYQPDANLRKKMLYYIEDARHKVIMQTSKANTTNLAGSISTVSTTKITKKTENIVNAYTAGFGTLYKTTNEIGIPIMVPMVDEIELEHDSTSPTFNNGAFMVYESMKWKGKPLVTIKRLHESPVEGGCVDLLIDELKTLSRIHFPSILHLMGICQTENIENLILMYERIELGSLFHVLHDKNMGYMFKSIRIVEIMMSICNALIYLHDQNILHCYVTSHSVILTSTHISKLANFEYAVEKATVESKQKRSRITDNHFTNCAYNWLAPEILADGTPTEMSDMYSYCVVLWELFYKTIPWGDMEWHEIKEIILTHKKTLPCEFDTIDFPLNRIIRDGILSTSPINRWSFDDVRNSLENLHAHLEKRVQMPKDISESGISKLSEITINSNVKDTNNNIVNSSIMTKSNSRRDVRSPSCPHQTPLRSDNMISAGNRLSLIQSYDNNTQKATPDEKRNYFSSKSQASNILNNSLKKFCSPIKRLNLSTVSQEDNTAVDRQPPVNPNTSNNNNNNETQKDNFSVITRTRRSASIDSKPKVDLKTANYYSMIGRSGSYTQLKDDNKSSLVNSARMSSRDSLVQENEVTDRRNQRSTIDGSSMHMPRSSTNQFFAGFGSVKNLVKLYENLPTKEKDVAEFKVQMIKQERKKEILNIVEKGKATTPKQDHVKINKILSNLKFNASAMSISSMNSSTTNVQVQPVVETEVIIRSTTTSKPPIPQQQQQPQQHQPDDEEEEEEEEEEDVEQEQYSTKIQQEQEENQLQQQQQKLNQQQLSYQLHKELSTISERTERSSSITCLFGASNSNGRYKYDRQHTHSSSLPTQTSYSTKSVTKPECVPPLEFIDISNRSSLDNIPHNVVNSVPNQSTITSQPDNMNANIQNGQFKNHTSTNSTHATYSNRDELNRSKRFPHDSSQEDLLSSLQGDESSVECSDAIYLKDFSHFLNK